jgi:hypothetical protein
MVGIAYPTLKRGANQHCTYGAGCGTPIQILVSHPFRKVHGMDGAGAL